MVEGNVNASNADVSGELKGSISVSELLALKSTAKLTVTSTNKLAIEPGASFTGFAMGAVIKDINHVGKQNKKKQPKRFFSVLLPLRWE